MAKRLNTSEEQNIVSSGAAGASKVYVASQRRRGRPPKNSKIPEYHVTTPAVPRPSLSQSSVPQSRNVGLPAAATRPSYRAAPKTIIKGNIIYERTETGEVIASVIRNGMIPSNMNNTTGTSVAPSTVRGRPPAEPRASTTPWVGASANDTVSIPADCPVHEDNVEMVLDQTISATQSVRRILLSLKDDLRRMGGGIVMPATMKPIHLQHRVDIASKLARAFAEYQQMIDVISSAKATSADATTITFPSSTPAMSPGSFVSPPVVTTAGASAKSKVAVDPPVLTPMPGSRRKSSAPVSSTKRKAAAAGLPVDLVSDDLCMSCDSPGD